MLDAAARRLIDPPLDAIGRRLAAAGVTADTVTLCGFAVGLLAVPLLAGGCYGAALAAILANRVADGLDGAIARRRGATDRGGFLDIVCDFLFYAAVVFGFALAQPEQALAAAFLLFAFVGTGASFLAYAAIAARRGLGTTARGVKSIYYLGGLTEGTETIIAFTLVCLWPASFAAVAWIFGALCLVTAAGRIAAGFADFRD